MSLSPTPERAPAAAAVIAGSVRTISVGLSRVFRIVEIDGTIQVDCGPDLRYRIEQAVRDPLTRKWTWRPLAFTPDWGEAHGALHQMQADFMDQLHERRTTVVR